jgi:hypothetical protein
MATTTYEPIIRYTLPSNTTSITLGSGGQGTIPSTYTDLVLVIGNFGMDSGGSATRLKFNGDSGSNYSATWLVGTGSTAASSRDSSQTSMRIMGAAVGPSTTNIDTAILNIPNYTSTNVYKNVLMRGSAATEAYSLTGLWRNTAAITSITLESYNGTHNILAGSTFTLYGIANADIGAKATGGVITYDDTYYYHTFGASGTFTPKQSLTADILVVAGGAGAGSYRTGGGGAGGLLGFASQSLTTTGYTVTVGAGGAGGAESGSTATGTAGNNGSDSQFGALTLVKGGGTGGWSGSVNGVTGGSGGGAIAAPAGSTAGSATSGQGSAGGTGQWGSPYYAAGGGGGAGAAGSNGTSASGGGAGGNGLSTYSSWGLVTGTGQNVSGTVYYAGGGAGGEFTGISATTAKAGGYGGGGSTTATSSGSYSSGGSGVANTGGGGAGSVSTDNANQMGRGGNGGSGVVIIRYLKA